MQLHKKKEIMEDILKKKRNIIDLIVEMKNLSGLAIDLGFSAILLQDRKLAEKVQELQEELDTKQYEIETECMLAANNVEEALGLTSVLRIASSVSGLSGAINELMDTIIRGIPPHPTIREALKSAADTVDHIKIGKSSPVVGKKIEEVTKDLVDVVGLKREDSWIYQPKDERIRTEDILVISGPKRKLNEVTKILRKS
jgi:uncharacterized protein with PhoU and TrkA domain